MIEEPKQPEHLTLVKTEETGLLSRVLFAIDNRGNVWRTTEFKGKQGEWRLFKKASEIVQAPPSFDQIVNS